MATLEMRFTRRYGEPSWQLMRIGPIQEEGKITGLVLLAADISTQKQALQKLLAEESLLRDLLELQDRERRMVAYEIHDGFIQDVVGGAWCYRACVSRLHRPRHRAAYDHSTTPYRC